MKNRAWVRPCNLHVCRPDPKNFGRGIPVADEVQLNPFTQVETSLGNEPSIIIIFYAMFKTQSCLFEIYRSELPCIITFFNSAYPIVLK